MGSQEGRSSSKPSRWKNDLTLTAAALPVLLSRGGLGWHSSLVTRHFVVARGGSGCSIERRAEEVPKPSLLFGWQLGTRSQGRPPHGKVVKENS